LSKKGWIIVDCSIDSKISKGMTNVANQLNVKLNLEKFYCKYEGTETLNENQSYNVGAELYLSKESTLYGKINRLNPVSPNISLSDSITISSGYQESKSVPPKKINEQQKNIQSLQNLTLSDDTINKFKLVFKEAFSEVLKESTKNLSMLVEVIKELAEVIDKKGQQSFDDKLIEKEEQPPIIDNKDLPFDDKDDLPNDLSDDLPSDDI